MGDSSFTTPEGSEDLRERLRELARERDLAYEALKVKSLEVEKLKMQLAKLRRMQFGQSSEKLSRQVDQLELAIEEVAASGSMSATSGPSRAKRRRLCSTATAPTARPSIPTSISPLSRAPCRLTAMRALVSSTGR